MDAKMIYTIVAWWVVGIAMLTALPAYFSYYLGKRYGYKEGTTLSFKKTLFKGISWSCVMSWTLTGISLGHGEGVIPLPSWLVIGLSIFLSEKFGESGLELLPPWWINPWIIIFTFILGVRRIVQETKNHFSKESI